LRRFERLGINVTVAGDPPPTDGPRYGRFLRRLQAVFIDAIVILLAIAGALFVSVTLNSQGLARTLGFSVAAGWLLYEPALLALIGGTVGHYVCNLRVVDNRTGANINFFKAVARTVIKALLGWLSFITMATTRRHQAIHDLLTRSTVQIRNPAKASAHHYSGEQIELSSAGMPSGTRRLIVIVLYLVIAFLVFASVLLGLEISNSVSPACILKDRCSTSERLVVRGLDLVWLGVIVLCIVLGWRGRLYGARKARTGP
jgi:uncharacterized RDD family membrane protein YckC